MTSLSYTFCLFSSGGLGATNALVEGEGLGIGGRGTCGFSCFSCFYINEGLICMSPARSRSWELGLDKG